MVRLIVLVLPSHHQPDDSFDLFYSCRKYWKIWLLVQWDFFQNGCIEDPTSKSKVRKSQRRKRHFCYGMASIVIRKIIIITGAPKSLIITTITFRYGIVFIRFFRDSNTIDCPSLLLFCNNTIPLLGFSEKHPQILFIPRVIRSGVLCPRETNFRNRKSWFSQQQIVRSDFGSSPFTLV